MSLRVAEQNQRPRLGLALSGGAARGMAHVGVLKVFEEEGVRVDCVAGTSAGALVGGALAAGMTSEEIEGIARGLRWRDLGRMTLSRLGIQSNALTEEYVRARFPLTRFEELLMPFAAVATDLHTGEAVVMRDAGDVAFAIRASCALPGWYVPVTDPDGRQLVDGGLVANLPTSVARSLGADVVVAVDVNYEGAKFIKPTTMVGVLLQSIVVVQQTAVQHERRLADVCISPAVGHLRWDEMKRTEEFIAAGIESARAALPSIKRLLEQNPSEDRSRLQLHHSRD
ncbi:MAG TPA: patatin-like phospholipase family protein [Pyrinomonadaceae bacterium]|nr:patatin-like phospholipase family protein [Pyrinomonadaceae bacterium]